MTPAACKCNARQSWLQLRAQVPVEQARAYKRMMPGAHLSIVEGGGHFAYFVGDPATQRRALSALLTGTS